tara:strand:+ start:261 stop:563 length:303 start_codon:yes stop_codon:yes gene_type:complete
MSNQSINNLVGTFTAVDIGNNYQLSNDSVICIDTATNRLGINTLEPEHEIDVSNNGTIRCGKLILTDLPESKESDFVLDTLAVGTVYADASGNLKIKQLP